MLSRVANSLYWIGRYLERAENMSRMVIVTSEVSVEIEGLDDKIAQREWDELLASVSSASDGGLDFSRETGLLLPYFRWLILDDSNPISMRSSITQARENVRSIREALTREVFLDLNECHHEIERIRRRRLRDPAEAREEMANCHGAVIKVLGSIEHTLSRDQGWTFLKLGEAMERTRRTLRVLEAKLPSLHAGSDDEDVPLYFARWRGLLRSVASLENYRASCGGALDPNKAIRFLLLERAAPRSVLCGVGRIRGYLDALPDGAEVSEADRILGRLHASLTYDDERILERDVVQFASETAVQLTAAHEAIKRQYFPR